MCHKEYPVSYVEFFWELSILILMNLFSKITSWRKLIREIKILVTAYSDKRTPLVLKIIAGILMIGYFANPFDIIPDFIPVFGILDDATVISLLAWVFSYWIPRDVLDDARKIINSKYK